MAPQPADVHELLHPFQQLARLDTASHGSVLLAALGCNLYALSSDQVVLGQWGPTLGISTLAVARGDNESPSKKSKTSASGTIPGHNLNLIATAPDSETVVVVTEDKDLIVLTLDDKGKFEERSRRPMPKRPSAVQIVSATETILCADKFGDVYSLPMFPSLEDDEKFAASAAQEKDAEQGAFKPSANELTVHSKRNRLALEMQQNQKLFTPRKAPLAFQHELLLGHVSMLTDMVYIATQADDQRSARIITADRDEHIRVSRAPPQAYITEGYCLGHTEFVCKLCPISETSLVVSGGGDDWLGIWDWQTFELLHRIDLREVLATVDSTVLANDQKLAVSLLSEVQTFRDANRAVILAVCERKPAVLLLTIDKHNRDAPIAQLFTTDGIPIAMAATEKSIVLSFDTRTTAGSRLRPFKVQVDETTIQLLPNPDQEKAVEALNANEIIWIEDIPLDSMLYTVSSLRKRRGWGEQNGDEE